jgi:hypothetical protein
MDTDPNQKLKGGILLGGNIKKREESHSWQYVLHVNYFLRKIFGKRQHVDSYINE